MIPHKFTIATWLLIFLVISINQLSAQQNAIPDSALPLISVRNKVIQVVSSNAKWQYLDLHFDTIPTGFVIDSSFVAEISIDHSAIGRRLHLQRSTVTQFFNLDQNITSGGISYITDDQFPFRCIFRRNLFNAPMVFARDSFINLTLIDNVLNARLEFMNCIFRKRLKIQQLEMTEAGSMSFQHSNLPDTVWFLNNTKLKNDVDFQLADYSEKTINICLYGSDISKLKLDYIHFRLFFDTTFFHGPDDSYDEKVAIYEALLNNFRSRGQLSSVENLDVEYRRFLSHHNWTSLFFYVHSAWNKCGYARTRVIFWTILIYFLFSWRTYYIIHKLNPDVYMVEKIPIPLPLKKAKRFWYACVYTANIFFRLTLKSENFVYERHWLAAYVFAMYVVGIVCLAYLADFVLHQ